MSKLKSKSEVIEWYWPDFLNYCLEWNEANRRDSDNRLPDMKPTVDAFWQWYITSGPMGVKHRNLYYTKEDIEYV